MGGGAAFSGIPWGPIIRLGLPALAIVVGLTALTWAMERRTRGVTTDPASGAGATSAAGAGEMTRDEHGALVRLPLAGRIAELRWCPPGRFAMGSPPGEPGRADSEELHPVQIGNGFWILASEVSNAQWAALTEGTPELPPDLPASELTLDQCLGWLERLNRLHPGLGARLPSEAEWEYACRAGSPGPFAIAEQPRFCVVPAVLAAWNEGGLFAAEGVWMLDRENPLLRPVPVAPAPLNPWGIAHMHGNVAEWCADRWDGESPYGEQARTDPLGQFGGFNVVRGGSWLHPAGAARSAARLAADPGEAKAWLGFRFVVPGRATPSWPPR